MLSIAGHVLVNKAASQLLRFDEPLVHEEEDVGKAVLVILEATNGNEAVDEESECGIEGSGTERESRHRGVLGVPDEAVLGAGAHRALGSHHPSPITRASSGLSGRRRLLATAVAASAAVAAAARGAAARGLRRLYRCHVGTKDGCRVSRERR